MWRKIVTYCVVTYPIKPTVLYIIRNASNFVHYLCSFIVLCIDVITVQKT